MLASQPPQDSRWAQNVFATQTCGNWLASDGDPTDVTNRRFIPPAFKPFRFSVF
jgi:hypothetical protein